MLARFAGSARAAGFRADDCRRSARLVTISGGRGTRLEAHRKPTDRWGGNRGWAGTFRDAYGHRQSSVRPTVHRAGVSNFPVQRSMERPTTEMPRHVEEPYLGSGMTVNSFEPRDFARFLVRWLSARAGCIRKMGSHHLKSPGTVGGRPSRPWRSLLRVRPTDLLLALFGVYVVAFLGAAKFVDAAR